MLVQDFGAASELAQRELDELTKGSGDTLVITDFKCISSGWVFFFNSKEFAETGDPMHALAGNGPIFVARDGTIRRLPSTVPWEQAVGDGIV